MLARTETDLTITERWLAQFERALSEGDNALLKMLFHADSHWRDVLPLTWRTARQTRDVNWAFPPYKSVRQA